MPTFEVDDQACFNAKVLRAGNEAFGAWCRAGSWCMANLTDGRVTRDVSRLIADEHVWLRLRDCGLPGSGLVEEADDGSGDWQIHDWDHWQRTADEILKHRESQAIRQRNRRALKRCQKPVTRDVPRDVPCDTPRDVPRESRRESRPPISPSPSVSYPTDTDEPSSPPVSKVRPRTKQQPLALPAKYDQALGWKVWRPLYKAKHGKTYAGPKGSGDGKYITELVKSAVDMAQEHASELGEALVPEMVESVLAHWFESYLADDGRNGFLKDEGHKLRFLMREVGSYGSPWDVEEPSHPVAFDYPKDPPGTKYCGPPPGFFDAVEGLGKL